MNNKIFYSEYFYQKGSKDTAILENNANKYPYSSLAAFVLLYHYKKTANPAFEKYAKKTALLFNNTHWLQFQLFDTSAPNIEQEVIGDEGLKEENAVATNGGNEITLETSLIDNVLENPVENSEKESIIHEHVKEENAIAAGEDIHTPLETSSIENVIEEPVENLEQEIISHQDVKESGVINAENNDETPPGTSSIEHFVEKPAPANEESQLKIQDTDIIEVPEEILNETKVETLIEETHTQDHEIPEKFEEPALSNFFQKNELTESEAGIKDNAIVETVTTENEPIEFHPLHVVDYFASQGIKITEELLTNDKLGNQMKSFTAWLKSMKKLHPGKLEEQSLATEKLIQASANESNFNTEILTEAMAEVLIKQDKKEKAIEMFTKLSLINPSKSAYFAARIDSIKSN